MMVWQYEIHDAKEDDYADADRDDVSDTSRSKRNQQRQCGFGTVGRRAERIQAEDRDALGRANAFRFFVFGRERLAEQ